MLEVSIFDFENPGDLEQFKICKQALSMYNALNDLQIKLLNSKNTKALKDFNDIVEFFKLNLEIF